MDELRGCPFCGAYGKAFDGAMESGDGRDPAHRAGIDAIAALFAHRLETAERERDEATTEIQRAHEFLDAMYVTRVDGGDHPADRGPTLSLMGRLSAMSGKYDRALKAEANLARAVEALENIRDNSEGWQRDAAHDALSSMNNTKKDNV